METRALVSQGHSGDRGVKVSCVTFTKGILSPWKLHGVCVSEGWGGLQWITVSKNIMAEGKTFFFFGS